jgi:hypothetical protein
VTIVLAAFPQIKAPSSRREWWGNSLMFFSTSILMLRCGNMTATRRMLSCAFYGCEEMLVCSM